MQVGSQIAKQIKLNRSQVYAGCKVNQLLEATLKNGHLHNMGLVHRCLVVKEEYNFGQHPSAFDHNGLLQYYFIRLT